MRDDGGLRDSEGVFVCVCVGTWGVEEEGKQ